MLKQTKKKSNLSVYYPELQTVLIFTRTHSSVNLFAANNLDRARRGRNAGVSLVAPMPTPMPTHAPTGDLYRGMYRSDLKTAKPRTLSRAHTPVRSQPLRERVRERKRECNQF